VIYIPDLCFISHNSGVFICRKVRDSELEALRKTAKEKAVEELPKLDQSIAELETKTSRLHAAFLFDDSFGLETLSMLCLCLSSTKNSYSFPGWEDFGIRLGLNPLLIKVKVDVMKLYDFI